MTNPDDLLPARGVANLYGVHIGSLGRWVEQGVLPAPDQIINHRRYWRRSTLEASDRQRTREHAAKTRPVKSSADREPRSAS